MKASKASGLGLFTVGIAALFLLGFFLLVVFGAQSYRDTVEGQEHNMRSRALLSTLATAVKGGDSLGAVTVLESEFGPVLEIAEGTTGYALRLYQKDGVLLEELSRSGAPLSPESAQAVGETEVFLPRLENGLLTVETDAGRVLLRLRAGEGEN